MDIFMPSVPTFNIIRVTAMTIAYLLVSHGSSDPRHRQGLMRLAQLVRRQLNPTLAEGQRPGMAHHPGLSHAAHFSPAQLGQHPFPASPRMIADLPTWGSEPALPLVGIATLEGLVVSLAQQIEIFGQRAMALGVRQLVVVPLFLLAGIHVTQDVPREIALAQQTLHPHLTVISAPYLGSRARLQTFLKNQLGATQAEKCVLLSHGSRRTVGNRVIQKLATRLDAVAAFWSVPPSLESQVIELMQSGYQRITIVPYFLFAGGITDTITRQTDALAERFPCLCLRLLPPMGMNAGLATVVADLAIAATPNQALREPLCTAPLPLHRDGITA
jgi:sirohydrochlorin cobaltochelatase